MDHDRRSAWGGEKVARAMALSFGLVVTAGTQAGPPPQYTTQVIQHTCAPPFPPSLTTGTGLNNHGQVCGYYWPCDGTVFEKIGFVWAPETGAVPITPPPGVIAVDPEDISDHGQITGTALIDGNYRGFLLSEGQWTFIEPLCGSDWSYANALNAAGAFIGDRQAPFGCAFPMWSFLYDGGVITEIVPARGESTNVNDISENYVAGWHHTGSGTQSEAFLWSAGRFTELQSPPGLSSTKAWAVTDCATAAGTASFLMGVRAITSAVRWQHGVPTVLLLLPGHVEAFARDINAKQNSIVGFCQSDSPPMSRATLWKDGKAFDLNSLIDEPGFTLGSASNINDKGQILCGATNSSGEIFAVLLTPSETLIGDLNHDGAVGGLDIALLLAAWGECADPCDCPIDLDDNQSVNGFDLAILLANWS